ncbi:MAG: serpin family protein [Opitutales bacterium]|nr:serpin family protein [Opitutales bacterium]
MKKAIFILFALFTFVFAQEADVGNFGVRDSIQSSLIRIGDCDFEKTFDPFATAKDLAPNLVSAKACDNAFAFDLFSRVYKESGKNFVFYPSGVREVLKVALLSSGGESQAELEKILGVKKSELEEELNSRGASLQNPEEGCIMSEANLFLVSNKFKQNKNFAQKLKKYFGADVLARNFSDAQGTANFVNKWVEKSTRAMIADAVEPSDFSPLTSVVVANAVAFVAKWETMFEKELTRSEKFKTAKSGEVDVEMMHKEAEKIFYAESSDFKAVKIPYKGGKYFFVCVLPLDENSAAQPNPEQFSYLWHSFDKSEVRLYLPRFKFETERADLKQALERLGAKQVFEFKYENFSEFFDVKVEQKIDKFFQKAFISIDEEGTKVAAVTFMGMATLGKPDGDGPKIFRADRPFSFFITNASGGIIFMGRVENPAKMGL